MRGGGDIVLRVFGLRHHTIMASAPGRRGLQMARSQIFVLLLSGPDARPPLAGPDRGSRCCESHARTPRHLALAAQFARLLAAAGIAYRKPTRRRALPSWSGGGPAVQPRTGRKPVGN